MQKNKLFILAEAILLISALIVIGNFSLKPEQPRRYKGPIEKITLAA